MKPTYTTIQTTLTKKQVSQLIAITQEVETYQQTNIKITNENTCAVKLTCHTQDAQAWRDIIIILQN